MSKYHLISNILEKPSDYKQCKFCKNPVWYEHHDCPTCGSQYFVPNQEKDFTHLLEELDGETEIQV